MIYIADPTPWLTLLTQPLHARTRPPTSELQGFLSQHRQPQQAEAQIVTMLPGHAAMLHASLDGLPASLLKFLNDTVLGILIADGLSCAGLTEMVSCRDSNQALGWVVVLDRQAFQPDTASAWLTLNERRAFTPQTDIDITLTVAQHAEDAPINAFRLLLLQAFGHVVSTMTDICPSLWSWPLPQVSGSFAALSHHPVFLPAPAQALEMPQEDIGLNQAPMVWPAAQAAAVYTTLARSHVPCLSASFNVQADFAACFATFIHTQSLGHPYMTTVTVQGEPVFASDDFWHSPRAAEKKQYLQTLLATLDHSDASTTFQGLAPFLRMSLSGADLRAYTQTLLGQANQDQDNAILWMNLATGFLCLKMREMGLAIQEQALELQRLYRRPAHCQPPRFRLLLIMTPGDLSENTPIDCLLENSPVELLYYYATPQQPLPTPMPAHDAVMVTLSDSRDNRALLLAVQSALANHALPIINPPHLLPNVNRDQLSELLQGIHGLDMPRTYRCSRQQAVSMLSQPAAETGAAQALPGLPMIIRPVGSQAGNHLARITSAEALATYLSAVDSAEFFVSRFVDYSSPDGQFRKYRVAMLRGVPFISHMAISSDWMVHYVNAGMYASAEKRAEECAFMQHFSQFATRHQAALADIYHRLPLDYLCIDCAETKDGQLLVFEIDHIMAVHAMDSASLFPFKAEQIAKLQQAFEQFLYDLQLQPIMESA